MNNKIFFKIFSDELSGKDFFGLLIPVLVLIVGFFSIPTILVHGDFLLNILKKIYSEHSVAYSIVFGIFTVLLSYAIYFFIKILYINKYKHFLYQEEAFSAYLDFMEDAKELYIFSGDLSFLEVDDNQFQKIVDLGKNSKVLCERLENNPRKLKLLKFYKELYDAGVQIKCYAPDTDINTSKFRGQIKLNNSLVYENLFMKKMDSTNRFIPIDIQNQYLTTLLKNDFDAIFKNATNPLIEYIIFDLGGVYFRGDFHTDFLNVLKNKYNINISSNRSQKLCLNKELMTGKQDIVCWLNEQNSRKLTKEKSISIKKLWKDIWSPDEEIKEIAKKLSKNYDLSVVSNLDKENGENYYQKGYLDIFKDNVFLSYELQMTKPDKELFKHIENVLEAMPYQILLISDHEINIQAVKKIGWNTIKYDNKVNNETALIEELEKINIYV